MIDVFRGDSRVLCGQEVRIIRTLMALDRMAFGELAPRDNGTEQHWRLLWLHRPDANHVCIVDGVIAGYLQMIPLVPWAARQLKLGGLGDGEIIDEHVPGREKPLAESVASIYVMSLVLHPAFRGLGLARRMWNTAACHWNREGRFAEGLVTVWTDHGDRFFQPLRGNCVGADANGHRVYTLNLDHRQLRPLPESGGTLHGAVDADRASA